MRFPTYVTGFSLAEIADGGSDCWVRRASKAAKLNTEIESDWLLDCFSLVMKLPGLCFVCFLTLTEILRRLKIMLIYAS